MVAILLAEGFEMLEFVAPLDALCRAKIPVRVVGVHSQEVVSSHGLRITAETTLGALQSQALTAVVLPGGPGYTRLQDPRTEALLQQVYARGGCLAAICAAPAVLGHYGFLQGRRACCYPGHEAELQGAFVCQDPVVHDGQIITSRGAGTALRFGLELVATLRSPELAAAVATQMQCPR